MSNTDNAIDIARKSIQIAENNLEIAKQSLDVAVGDTIVTESGRKKTPPREDQIEMVQQFLDDKVEYGLEPFINHLCPKADLYESFKEYIGDKNLSKQRFNRILIEVFSFEELQDSENNNRRVWGGVSIHG